MVGRDQVDLPERRATATLLERYLQQKITNDELADGWPASRDPAVREVERLVWHLNDDLVEHRHERGRASSPPRRAAT